MVSRTRQTRLKPIKQKKRNSGADEQDTKTKRAKRTQKWETTSSDSVRMTRQMGQMGQMEAYSSRDAVFGTAELLETIALNLPIQSLYYCRRVNRTFYHVLAGSTKVHDVLLHRSDGSPRQYWRAAYTCPAEELDGPSDWFFVAVTSSGKPLAPSPGLKYLDELFQTAYSKLYTPLRLNPIFKKEHTVISGKRRCYAPGSNFLPPEITVTLASLELGRKAREMPPSLSGQSFLTRPPCFMARVHLAFVFPSGNGSHGASHLAFFRVSRDIKRAEGLRLGDLILLPLAIPGDVQYSLLDKYSSPVRRFIKNPERLLRRMERDLGVLAVLDTERFTVGLKGVVIPTEEEWETVR